MAHEDLSRDQRVEGSSDRSFGLVFACAFLLIAIWPVLDGAAPRPWALGVSAFFGLAALLRPALLAGANRVWISFGVLLGKLISPAALGVLFYGVLTPIGLLMRMAGKDTLRLGRDPEALSYWLPREPPGPPPDSMGRQF